MRSGFRLLGFLIWVLFLATVVVVAVVAVAGLRAWLGLELLKSGLTDLERVRFGGLYARRTPRLGVSIQRINHTFSKSSSIVAAVRA